MFLLDLLVYLLSHAIWPDAKDEFEKSGGSSENKAWIILDDIENEGRLQDLPPQEMSHPQDHGEYYHDGPEW